MKQNNYARYYRVFQNDTVVTEISTNNFRQQRTKPVDGIPVTYCFPVNEPFFYGYSTMAKAMEMAKAGALKHIDTLIAKGKKGEKALFKYRFDHFQDLTVNLVERNVENIEDEFIADHLQNDDLRTQNDINDQMRLINITPLLNSPI
jgi:hypothetical protein